MPYRAGNLCGRYRDRTTGPACGATGWKNADPVVPGRPEDHSPVNTNPLALASVQTAGDNGRSSRCQCEAPSRNPAACHGKPAST